MTVEMFTEQRQGVADEEDFMEQAGGTHDLQRMRNTQVGHY